MWRWAKPNHPPTAILFFRFPSSLPPSLLLSIEVILLVYRHLNTIKQNDHPHPKKKEKVKEIDSS